MATQIQDTIDQMEQECSDDQLRALHRACAWNVPDIQDMHAALKFGQPTVLKQVLHHSKLSAAERPALAYETLIAMCASPLDYARPDRMAEVLVASGANEVMASHTKTSPLQHFAQQLGRIEAEEDHNALINHAHNTGAGAKLRRLWDVLVSSGAQTTAAHDIRMSAYHDKSTLLTQMQKRKDNQLAEAKQVVQSAPSGPLLKIGARR